MKRSVIVIITVLLGMGGGLLVSAELNKSDRQTVSDDAEVSSQTKSGPTIENPSVSILNFSTEESDDGFKITNLVLKNSAHKDVRKVEITWYVVKENGDGTVEILEKGLPTLRLFPNGLKAGDEARLKFTGINIQKMALGGSQIKGPNQIKLAVTNVFFTDGSKWKKESMIRKV